MTNNVSAAIQSSQLETAGHRAPATQALPRHAPMTQWPVVDDCLVVGGLAVTTLARRIGRTPFYAYDRKVLSERGAALRHHLPAGITLTYALHATPLPA